MPSGVYKRKVLKQKIICICNCCNKIFYTYYSWRDRKYCSVECYNSMRGSEKYTHCGFQKGHKDFVGEEGRKKQSKKTKGVKKGKQKNPNPWWKGRKFSEKHKENLSIAHLKSSQGKAENHWHWKGGIWNLKGDNKRNDPKYQRWRRSVKLRDKQTCRLKDNNCSGRLEVHHIKGWAKYPKLRYEIKNGITLCKFHHPRKKADEKRFIPIFEKILSTNN